MELSDIMALVKAGFSRDDIMALTAPASEPAPQPAAEPAPQPASEPAPQPAAEPAPRAADPAGRESLLKEVLGGVQKSVDDLRSTVQASQVLTGVQAAPASREDALRTAAEHAAGIFRPVQNK